MTISLGYIMVAVGLLLETFVFAVNTSRRISQALAISEILIAVFALMGVLIGGAGLWLAGAR